MRLVKVAGIQSGSQAFDLPGSLHKVAELTAKAVKDGAQFVVFPEAFVSGYPRHLGFKIGSRSGDDREWYTRYVKVCFHDCLRRSADEAEQLESAGWD